MTFRQATSPLWFAVPFVVVYAAAFFVVEVLPTVDAPGTVAAGLTLDLVVIVPALYYVVLVRGRKWPAITLAPVFLLSFGAASVIVPDAYHGLLNAIRYALPVVELTLVGYVAYRAWHVVRSGRDARSEQRDFYVRMRTMLRVALDVPVAAGVLAYEVSLFRYAFSFRSRAATEGGYSYHRRTGYGAVLTAILIAAGFELAAAHVLLRLWSETAALVHLAVSLYGIVWLVGDYRAMRQRPHELDIDGIRLRLGLRWDIEVSWEEVAAVFRARRPGSDDEYLSMAPIGNPAYIIEFRAPVEAIGPYGLVRKVRRVGLVVDDSAAFERALQRFGVRVEE